MMEYVLTLIGSLIIVLSAIPCLFFLIYFLAHASMILGFWGEYKETLATLTGFALDGTGAWDDPVTYNPILTYYNEYQGKDVTKELMNSGIYSPKARLLSKGKAGVADVGEKIKIQYTRNFVRVSDERFVSKNKYQLMRYMLPIILCLACGTVGFVVLVIGILI